MANTASAKKAARQMARRTVINKARRSRLRNHVGKVEDALRVLQRKQPRVVVSDLMIPGHDGFTLIRRIRRMAKGEGGDLPAVAISGFDTADQRPYAIDEGFDEFSTSKELMPGLPETHSRLADIFYRSNDGENTIAEARTAWRASSRHSWRNLWSPA